MTYEAMDMDTEQKPLLSCCVPIFPEDTIPYANDNGD